MSKPWILVAAGVGGLLVIGLLVERFAGSENGEFLRFIFADNTGMLLSTRKQQVCLTRGAHPDQWPPRRTSPS